MNIWITCQFDIPLQCLSERETKGNNKGGQLFGAILRILNRKVKRSPLICQTFRKKNQ